jgi:hypothetical protein
VAPGVLDPAHGEVEAQLRLGGEPREGRGRGGRVSGGHEEPACAISECTGHAPDVRRDDGQPSRHRLEQHLRESLR